ncbi:hypothetical protein LINPERPRIM_LOCUS35496, partial [Linum perenne]
ICSLRLHRQITDFQPQTKQGTALLAILSIIDALLLKEKMLKSVRSLLNTTVLFAPVNGLIDGMSKGRMVHSQVLFKVDGGCPISC